MGYDAWGFRGLILSQAPSTVKKCSIAAYPEPHSTSVMDRDKIWEQRH